MRLRSTNLSCVSWAKYPICAGICPHHAIQLQRLQQCELADGVHQMLLALMIMMNCPRTPGKAPAAVSAETATGEIHSGSVVPAIAQLESSQTFSKCDERLKRILMPGSIRPQMRGRDSSAAATARAHGDGAQES